MTLPATDPAAAIVAMLAAALAAFLVGLFLLARQSHVSRRIARTLHAGENLPEAAFSAPPQGDRRILPGGRALPPSLLALVAPGAAEAERLRALFSAPSQLAASAAVLFVALPLSLHAAGLDALHIGILTPLLALLLARLGLRRASTRDQRQFKAQLPDAIALMVRGIRAGVPVAEAVAEVGREFAAPMGPAFRGAHEQVRLGQPLEAALWAVAARAGLPEMNFLCVTIAVQRETGGNLGETLTQLEQMIRKRTALQQKVRALSSEARASALIIGALPLLMAAGLFVMAPDYVAPLVETGAGRLLLATAVACLVLGGLVMTHIVRSQAAS